MADRWTWSASDWARIERVAREHRAARARMGELTPGVARKATLAVAQGTVFEMRQWAKVACTSYSRGAAGIER
jgi:hypothetical protein